MSLRECQTDAINCIKDRYQKPGETNIQMCTGSGKSMIIRHASLLPDVSRCIIVFPSLLLVQQYYENHGKYYKNLKYLATEGTLTRITNIVSNVTKHLSETFWTILTTFASVPVIYSALNTTSVANLVIVDEAHHINGEVYNEAAENACDFIGHRVHFSATLPEGKDAHYKYSLLRGIADRVVRDFNIQLFICREGSTASFAEMINSIIDISIIPPKILVYTAEANTDGSSVKTFMETYGDIAAASGWWFDGIKSDTGNRNKLLRSFETSKAAATILVSCKTISEGVDLQGANVMLPWDPTTSVVDNIQRIGRVVRLYKKRDGSIADFQPPSTILIPVFLSADDYEGISGNKDAIHAMLEKQISEGEHGNFAPIVNVCTALKSELAEEDAELFNKLLYYPGRRPEPHVRIDGSLVNCVARSMKRDIDEVKEEVGAWLAENVSDDENDISDVVSEESDDISDVVAEELGDITEESDGNNDELIEKSTPLQLIDAITNTQNVAIIVKDNGIEEKFGDSAKVITIERDGDNYNISKKKKDLSSGAKQVTKRFSATFSDECKIMLGLEDVVYDVNGATNGLIITKLTSKVEYEAGEEAALERWKKRIADWEAYCKENKIDKFSRLPTNKSENPIEKPIGEAISGYKKALKGKGLGKYYESVDKLLIDSGYNNWLDIRSLEEFALEKWTKYIQQWEEICEHEKIDRFSRLPNINSKNPIEKTIGKAIHTYKTALKGVRGHYYESVNKLLIDSGYINWLDNRALEEKTMEKWQTYIHQWEEMCEREKIDKFSRLPTNKSENPIEKPIGEAIHSYKKALKGKGLGKYYESVTKLLLDSGYHNWLDISSPEEIALRRWQNYIQQWEEICEHEKIDRFSRLPNINSKNPIEITIGLAIRGYRGTLKGNKSTSRQYESVNKLLIDSGYNNWLDVRSLEELALEKWQNYIQQWEEICKREKIDRFSRLPSQISKNLIEKTIGKAICDYKCVLRGTSTNTYYESVNKLLIDSGYINWLDNRTLEEKTMEKWQTYIHQWEEMCEHEKIDRFSRLPNSRSENPIEKPIGEAISGYKKALKGKGLGKYYESVNKLLIDSGYNNWLDVRSLEELALEKWQNYIQQWEEICKREKIDRFSRLPNSRSKNSIEKPIGAAIGHYKNSLKGKGLGKYYESVNKLLIDSGYRHWLAPGIEPLTLETPPEKIIIKRRKAATSEETESSTPAPTRRRKPIKTPTDEPIEHTGKKHIPSQLEVLHQKYKIMKSAKYYKHIASNPDAFAVYHDVADAHDTRDAPENRPIEKIASILAKCKLSSRKKLIDLGCGRNRLRHHPAVAKLNWTSVDAVAVDETVVQADIGALPFADGEFDVAIMCRSLWAQDHHTQLAEAHKILDAGGKLIICESFRRWWNSGTGENALVTAVTAAGFTVEVERGTAANDTDDVFQYIIAKKMDVVITI